MVVTVGEGIVRGVPFVEPSNVPPHEPEYQFRVVPEPPVTLSMMLPASSAQNPERSDIADAGATGSGRTMSVAGLLVTKTPQASVTTTSYDPALPVTTGLMV